MRDHQQFYIDGQWVTPLGGGEPFEVVNPATEAVAGTIRLGSDADVELAVVAARRAFDSYSRTTLQQRCDLLANIGAVYERRLDDLAVAISEEMGAPLKQVARTAQAPLGLWHLQTTLAMAAAYPFEQQQGSTLIVKEPVGVCALITPWNWPMNQIVCKVAPALLVGCTMVLKPSEFAPFSAQILAEILHEAGVPAGVFNMIHGDGAKIGPALSAHPQVDMVSLTGSTRAGASVARHAADTIKVVSLELGGKSANIILDDAPLEQAVTAGVMNMMFNSGQSCNAPSRMLVPRSKLAQAEKIAVAALERLVVGDPANAATTTGPLANRRQFQRVQALIDQGISEGATLVAGGLGLPDGITRGYFTKPTVFSQVHNRMRIAREEIFGPVLTMLAYESEEEAIDIANDSDYGLCGYVFGGSVARATAVAKRLRTGMVHLNGAGVDPAAPFGGYKQSGVGREWGAAGIDEFVETKAVMGAVAPAQDASTD
ncbi:aldehyde dehydrogenase family protein [Paraburkholderia sp.]|uniref:aldehyde dehydrogenase family protein n=1 Tax=Paraburkholderia sp. TaxID=1926495 RepID=UPI002D58162E|nr:aldehyde dehydrogenase family protein [Paraburkholderia sp.]HZZ02305.1 aldehyde dehydrogenase family protein [Paraburkholderia sp.]